MTVYSALSSMTLGIVMARTESIEHNVLVKWCNWDAFDRKERRALLLCKEGDENYATDALLCVKIWMLDIVW